MFRDRDLRRFVSTGMRPPEDPDSQRWINGVVALSADDGTLQWSQETEFSDGLNDGLAVSPSGALFTADDGSRAVLRRRDPVDGAEIWAQETDVIDVTAMVADDEVVFLGGGNDALGAYDAASGQLIWSRGGDPITRWQRRFPAMAISGTGDLAIAQVRDPDEPRAAVQVVQRTTGAPLWSYASAGELILVGGGNTFDDVWSDPRRTPARSPRDEKTAAMLHTCRQRMEP